MSGGVVSEHTLLLLPIDFFLLFIITIRVSSYNLHWWYRSQVDTPFHRLTLFLQITDSVTCSHSCTFSTSSCQAATSRLKCSSACSLLYSLLCSSGCVLKYPLHKSEKLLSAISGSRIDSRVQDASCNLRHPKCIVLDAF